MDLFFLSIALIFSGGILSPIFNRQFAAMKLAAVIPISAGCLIGLVDAGSKLTHAATVSCVIFLSQRFFP